MNGFWQSWFNINPHAILQSLVYDIWPNIAASAILGTAIFYKLYKRDKCSSCWRLAHISVKGTYYKTCHKHSTIAHHKELQALHKQRHPAEHKLLSGGK